ncbi:hypothetical protein V8G54_000974 [Vigna mungo]|uniref:Uncharacterized protein n=1 Tax=Vigna mungo TaxID=3915 RepID=A0AAQ3P7E4_VIGMU
MSLKERLASITKGNSSISEYLRSIRFLVDELTLIGHPMDDLDLVIATLNSLGPSFREFNASIRVAPLTANHANRFSSSANRGKRYSRDSFPPTKTAPPPFRHPSSPPHSCRSSSHMVPTFQYYDHCGHTAKTCYLLHGFPARLEANSVTYVMPNDSAWLVDSGASNHVTNDMGSLSISNEYAGNDQLMVAKGAHHLACSNLPLSLLHELHEPTKPPLPSSPSSPLTIPSSNPSSISITDIPTETVLSPNTTTASSSLDLSMGSLIMSAVVKCRLLLHHSLHIPWSLAPRTTSTSTNSVNKLSQYIVAPTETHMQAAKRILQYSKTILAIVFNFGVTPNFI